MKKLEHIKDEIAQEIGYESADNYLSELYEIGSIYTLERITLFINEIATRTAKEALRNASDNLIEWSYERHPNFKTARESILNESNIPYL